MALNELNIHLHNREFTENLVIFKYFSISIKDKNMVLLLLCEFMENKDLDVFMKKYP